MTLNDLDYWLRRTKAEERVAMEQLRQARREERWARWRMFIVLGAIAGGLLLQIAINEWRLDQRIYCWWQQCEVSK